MEKNQPSETFDLTRKPTEKTEARLIKLLLRVRLALEKANINTTIGFSFESLARDYDFALKLMSSAGISLEECACPVIYARNTIERRKEKYGRRILKLSRALGEEPEGIKYLKRHFHMHLNDILNGNPIPEQF